jgi:formate-dependent nitrite reductase membrane component NrfD
MAVGTRDGRNVDPALGRLAGEGAQIVVKGAPAGAYPAGTDILAAVPSDAAMPGYYGQPVLKSPTWIWSIPVYFYAGGLAGAASLVSAATELGGGRRLGRLSLVARLVATLGMGASAGLLIVDLGRPARFLYMLRVFRPSSPMNVGTWILSASGLSSGAALLAAVYPERGLVKKTGAVAAGVAGLLGPPLMGYTAVLLACTAVPLWQGGRRTMPFLFTGSALASLGALLELWAPRKPAERRVVRRIALVGKAWELVAMMAFAREVGAVPEVARPLREGRSGALWRAAAALGGAGLLVSALPFHSRRKDRLAGALGTAAALALRFAVFEAGKASARDPRATFASQRASDILARA